MSDDKDNTVDVEFEAKLAELAATAETQITRYWISRRTLRNVLLIGCSVLSLSLGLILFGLIGGYL